MTPRERVLCAFAKVPADRVPVDYQSNPGTDRRLKWHLGLSPADMDGLLAALGVDFRSIAAPYVGARIHVEIPDRSVDPQWGIRSRYVEHSTRVRPKERRPLLLTNNP